MKKLVLIFFITFQSLYSCGCWDSGLANQGAESMISTFDDYDEQTAEIIDAIQSQNEDIKELEKENEEYMKKIIKANVFNYVELRKVTFETNKINDVINENGVKNVSN